MTRDAGKRDSDGLKTPRTTLRRKPDRGSHDWETIAAILDEGLICHIAFETDGQPYAIPTNYGRDGRTLYIHGSPASRFHHSMNYRSEASAKVRPGGVADEPEDIGLPVWAGRLPLSLVAGEPETDPDVAPGHVVPPYLRDYKRGR